MIEPEEGVRFLVVDGKYTFVELDGSIRPVRGFAGADRAAPLRLHRRRRGQVHPEGGRRDEAWHMKFDEWGEKEKLVVDQGRGKGTGSGGGAVAGRRAPRWPG